MVASSSSYRTRRSLRPACTPSTFANFYEHVRSELRALSAEPCAPRERYVMTSADARRARGAPRSIRIGRKHYQQSCAGVASFPLLSSPQISHTRFRGFPSEVRRRRYRRVRRRAPLPRPAESGDMYNCGACALWRRGGQRRRVSTALSRVLRLTTVGKQAQTQSWGYEYQHGRSRERARGQP